jgi:NADH-quinone oxidoreductase subunit N
MFEYFSNLFLGFGLISLIFGSLAAFAQQDLRRFLAYTSIAHMGSIFISLHIMDDLGFFAALQYLAIYVVSSSIIFYCLSTTYSIKNNSSSPITFHSISELRYLKSTSMKSAIALTVAFLSMAGAAPLAGF